jgi:polyferredoxin
MIMKELDLLKKDWQKNNAFEQVSEVDIYKMLHTKSSSIVKWIFIISVLEILLWTSISVFFNTDDYLKNIKHEELNVYFEALTYFNYAVILVFIYLFYKNYVSISTTVSTKQLMKDILKTRKTVQCYVWYNLGVVALSLMIGFFMAFNYNPEVAVLMDKIGNNTKVMVITIGVFALIIAAFLGIFWLFYRLLYGILLRRLYANYSELKKIDL